jgi:signal transduction histidine kinase
MSMNLANSISKTQGTADEQREKLEATIAALQKANASLEQQLKDSEIELQATVDEFLLAKQETERAKAEAERASSVKSAFLASMSHELRTPLNAIINFTKFVAKGSMGPVNTEQVETLNEVVDSAKHLLNLINDVLDMSKIEAGSLKLFIDPNVDVNAILKTVAATGKSLLADKPVMLHTDIQEGLPSIAGDRQRILQILLNIMSNACKFSDSGQIKVRANQTNDEIIFAIEDSGPGISADDQSAVFEAFKQTATGLRQGGGTGLGMPISKSLAEAHGGRLWLESEPGKGSTFFLALPVKTQNSEPVPVVLDFGEPK